MSVVVVDELSKKSTKIIREVFRKRFSPTLGFNI
tara:strand:- start:839 stop:940 length:102 start_codon:yes stop_codon:yes gene_type:complete